MRARSARNRSIWGRRALLGLALAALILGGCGDDEPEGGSAEAPTWSDPAANRAKGSPDGDPDGVKSAESLLSGLLERIEQGRGHSDPTFDRDVQSVAAVIWAPDGTEADMAAAQVHVQISAIAGEVGRWLKASEGARAEREKSNPTDVAIYDAWRLAIAKGAEPYRAWCAKEGAALLEAHRKASYGRFFPPK